MPINFTSETFENFQRDLFAKIDALTRAFSTMAGAMIAQAKEDVTVNDLMARFFEAEIKLLNLDEDEKKTPMTEADAKY